MIDYQNYMQKTLAEFVGELMDKKRLSGYDIERLSGKRITQSYVNRIKNGDSTNPTIETLQALATGLGIPEDEIFAVARGVDLNVEDVPLQIKIEGFEGLDNKDIEDIAEFIKFKKLQKK